MVKTITKIISQIEEVINFDIKDISFILHDLRFSHYKVRAIKGNLEQIISQDDQFIKLLWKMDKINNIVNQAYSRLSKAEKKVLFDYLKTVEQKTIRQTKFIDQLGPQDMEQFSKVIKLEVFKTKNNIH